MCSNRTGRQNSFDPQDQHTINKQFITYILCNMLFLRICKIVSSLHGDMARLYLQFKSFGLRTPRIYFHYCKAFDPWARIFISTNNIYEKPKLYSELILSRLDGALFSNLTAYIDCVGSTPLISRTINLVEISSAVQQRFLKYLNASFINYSPNRDIMIINGFYTCLILINGVRNRQ